MRVNKHASTADRSFTATARRAQNVRPSPVGLTVLALLAEGPSHPYGMQRLIKDRAVDAVVNVRNRSGLHAAISRLAKEGLIWATETGREGNRPERTVYELTGEGHETVHALLRDYLATPVPEFPLFPAVVSFMHLLEPEDARQHLATRAEALQRDRDSAATELDNAKAREVERLHLLENEHQLAVVDAELKWVRGIVKDIDERRLWWTRRRQREHAPGPRC